MKQSRPFVKVKLRYGAPPARTWALSLMGEHTFKLFAMRVRTGQPASFQHSVGQFVQYDATHFVVMFFERYSLN